MKISSRPQLIIFDLDGTLADTAPQLALAVQQSMRKLGLKVPSLETVKEYVGNGVNLLLARTLAGRFEAGIADVDAELLKQARELFNRFYQAGLKDNFTLYPGVLDGLQAFKSLGIKCAVVTNKPDVFARPLLGFMGVTAYLDFILGGEVIPARKPDPEPLFYVCRQLRIDPAHAVMAGDSVNDIKAGQRAGMPTVGFTYGYNRGQALDADYVYDRFADFTALVQTSASCA